MSAKWNSNREQNKKTNLNWIRKTDRYNYKMHFFSFHRSPRFRYGTIYWNRRRAETRSSVSLITCQDHKGATKGECWVWSERFWKLDKNIHHSFLPFFSIFCILKSIVLLGDTIIKRFNCHPQIAFLSNLDDPVIYTKMWLETKKVTEKSVVCTQSVRLAAMNNALWHFPSNKIETIWAKLTRPKSALRLSLDVSRIHPASVLFFFFFYLSQFFKKGKCHLAHFGNPILWTMEKEKKKIISNGQCIQRFTWRLRKCLPSLTQDILCCSIPWTISSWTVTFTK